MEHFISTKSVKYVYENEYHAKDLTFSFVGEHMGLATSYNEDAHLIHIHTCYYDEASVCCLRIA